MVSAKAALVALIASLGFIAGCRTTGGSTVKDDEPTRGRGGDCPCSDLQCWRQKSGEAAAQQFECAKDALSAAASLSTGGLANAAEISIGLIDVGQALADKNLYALLSSAGDVTAVTLEAFGPEGKPVVECVKSSATIVAQVFDVINTMKSYDPQGTAGLTDIVSAIAHTMDANHHFANAMLQCMTAVKLASDNSSLKSFGKFMEGWTKILGNVDAAIAVVGCGGKITNGGMVLIQNTQCLVQDLKNLDSSRRAVARALAFSGSRAFNHGRFTGCGCVSTHFWQSARTELDNCKACCDGNSGIMHDDEPNKRSLWDGECKLSCNVAFTNGIFWDYMDTRTCDDVKSAAAADPTRINYRFIDLRDAGSQVPVLLQVQQNRADLLLALAQLGSGFANVDNACPNEAAPDGTISKAKLACCARTATGPLKDACTLFGVSYTGDDGVPYFWRLLDTADVPGEDDKAGPSAVSALTEELSRYQDEVEAQ